MIAFAALIEYDGQTLKLWQWARLYGVPALTIRNRLFLGWSMRAALETPRRAAMPACVRKADAP